MNKKKLAQTSPFYPLPLFGSHLDPLQHFRDLFSFSRCLLPSHFGKWTTFLHCLLSLVPHLHLDHTLVDIATNMSEDLVSTLKNLPSTNSNKKSTDYSTSTSWSTFAYVVFFSTCSSSLKSLLIMITDLGVKNAFKGLAMSLQVLP
jgi:hypothetical protein